MLMIQPGQRVEVREAGLICTCTHISSSSLTLAVSGHLTWLSIPSMSSMEKNSMAHSGDTGSWVTASG